MVLRREVGQATCGNHRGLYGGQLTWDTLPHSGAAVNIPLLAARYDATTPGASVTPDVVVCAASRPRPREWIRRWRQCGG